MKTVGHVVVVGPSAAGSEQLLVLCWLRSLTLSNLCGL